MLKELSAQDPIYNLLYVGDDGFLSSVSVRSDTHFRAFPQPNRLSKDQEESEQNAAIIALQYITGLYTSNFLESKSPAYELQRVSNEILQKKTRIAESLANASPMSERGGGGGGAEVLVVSDEVDGIPPSRERKDKRKRGGAAGMGGPPPKRHHANYNESRRTNYNNPNYHPSPQHFNPRNNANYPRQDRNSPLPIISNNIANHIPNNPPPSVLNVTTPLSYAAGFSPANLSVQDLINAISPSRNLGVLNTGLGAGVGPLGTNPSLSLGRGIPLSAYSGMDPNYHPNLYPDQMMNNGRGGFTR